MSQICNSRAVKNPPARAYRRAGVKQQPEGGLPGCRGPDRLAVNGDGLEAGLHPGPQMLWEGRGSQLVGARLTLPLPPPKKKEERRGGEKGRTSGAAD